MPADLQGMPAEGEVPQLKGLKYKKRCLQQVRSHRVSQKSLLFQKPLQFFQKVPLLCQKVLQI